jgi:hypothetical protein
MTAYGGRQGIVPLILSLAIRWRSAVGFTLQLLCPLKKGLGIHWILGGLKIWSEQPGVQASPLHLLGTHPRFYGRPAPNLANTERCVNFCFFNLLAPEFYI